jgi:hypothetical protein
VGTRDDDKQRAQRLHSEGDIDAIILDSSQGIEWHPLQARVRVLARSTEAEIICSCDCTELLTELLRLGAVKRLGPMGCR